MKFGTVGWAVLIAVVALIATVWVGSRYGVIPAGSASTDIKDDSLDLDWPPISPNPPYPAVFVENGKEYGFGIMASGESGEHIFVVENKGEAPLILQQGRSSCKCTFSAFAGDDIPNPVTTPEPEQPAPGSEDSGFEKPGPARVTVPPGKSTEIKLSWKTQDGMPIFSQGVSILTNDPQNQVVKLYIKGEVAEEIALAPLESWSVGAVLEGEPVTITGYLFSRLVDHFSIESIETSSELVTAEATPLENDELTRREINSGYAVKVTVQPQVPLGRLRELLKVTAFVRNHEKKFEVPITGYRPGPYRILPVAGVDWRQEISLLDFHAIGQDKNMFALPFFVMNLNEGEFKILSYESDVPDLKVRLESGNDEASDDKQYRLVLEFPKGHQINRSDPPYAKLTVKTNHPDASEITLFLKFLSL